MRIQHYKREDTIGTHNFDVCQLYVGTLSNPKGELFRGITILWAGGATMEAHLPLSKDMALKFSNYLDSVVAGNFPSKFKVLSQRSFLLKHLLAFYMKFSKSNGNYIKCRASFNMCTMWGSINTNSINACSESLRKLYASA